MRRLARAQLARPPQDTQFKLEASGMKAASLHGEMSKMERQQVLAKFRAGGYRAMVRRLQAAP
jgi:superfamily II DNA/RNA helicase